MKKHDEDKAVKMDYYNESAEYYDIISTYQWGIKKQYLKKFCKALPKTSDPILDLGAGTGNASIEIAKCLPDATILGIEPSPQMRTAFASKIARKSGYSHITIYPFSVLEFEIPKAIRGATCLGVIGHLTAQERYLFYNALATKMIPNGILMIDILDEKNMNMSSSDTIIPVRQGELEYSLEVEEESDSRERFGKWLFTYKVIQENKIIHKIKTTMEWERISASEIISDLSTHGFIGAKITDTLIIARFNA